MVKIFKCLPLLGLGLMAVGCQDYDAGVTLAEINAQKYARNFEKVFGNIDPEQDWSMAQQITANVSGVEDGMLEIYYSDPIGGQPVMITKRKIVNGEATFKFDVVKGTKQIFARIHDGKDFYSLKSNYKIVDGVVNIGNGATRAVPIHEGAVGSEITKSEAYSLTTTQLLDHDKDVQIFQNASGYEDKYIDGIYGVTIGVNTSYIVESGAPSYLKSGEFTNLYNVYGTFDNSVLENRPMWYVKDVAHFFESIDGKAPVFKEGENHVKLMKEGSDPQLAKDLVFTMETDGPFYLDYFYKGTKYDNRFGYFYFTGDIPSATEFLSIPKFVIVDNMSYSPYLAIGEGQSAIPAYHTSATEMVPWDLLGQKFADQSTSGWEGIGFAENGSTAYDTKIVGTRFQLVYFGEDGMGTGTYNFPADTKIGLFFIGNHDDQRDNLIISSISKLNLDLYNETPHAASFQHNNQVVFAMEDMRWGGDADVNDAMFIANGTFKKDEIPHIQPTKPVYPTWIIACEDLGGTFDYDFNDVVIGLRKEAKGDGTKSDLYLVPLAAGGTLQADIYYGDTKKGEIHDMVSPGAPTTNPLNVGAGSNPGAGTAILLGEVDSDKSINECAAEINIKVTKDETITENSNTYNVGYKKNDKTHDYGSAPQAIILPSGWDWPSENTFIGDVYEGITAWVADGDVTAWCNTKKVGASIVHNPLPAVPTPSEGTGGGESGEGGGSQTPTVDPTNPEWNITVSGYASMEKGATQTLTITIDGVSDYTGLTFGTYSTTVISAAAVDGHPNQFTINAINTGSALFWVKMPADDTHNLTRKEYEITVTNPTPVFSFKLGDTVINDGDTYTHTWNGGYDFVSGTLTLTKGTGYRMLYSSSNTSVVEVSAQGLNVKGAGTAEVTIKHQAGSDGSTTWEEVSMTFTVVINAPGTGGGETGGGNEPEKDPITAGTYNLTIPASTTYTASWGTTYQAYTMSVGDYSCPDGLTGTVTITLKDCPSNELEIAPSAGNWLGRIQFYNGDKTKTQTLTNAQLKQLLAGDFNVISYASSDVEMTSFTLVVE